MICKCSAYLSLSPRTRDGMYRKVPKVSSHRGFNKIPLVPGPQSFTYHLLAEDLTRGGLVSVLSAEERNALLNQGELPRDSSAKDRVCVMCPVRMGTPCLCNN